MPRNDAPHEPSILIGATEAARLIDFSHRWLQREIASGRVPVVRVGSSVRLRRSDVETFAKSGKWPAAPGI